MPEALDFLVRHGYTWLFVVIFAEQLGLPLPAAPVLLGIGALLGQGNLTFAGALLIAAAAAGLADHAWFQLGRRKGGAALRLLCRVSLEPDSCVSNSRAWFQRLGPAALLIAKFIPGLNAVAVPVAGTSHMPLPRFAAYQAAGTLIWASTLIGLGYTFRRQLSRLAELAFQVSSSVAVVVGVPLAAYLLVKYLQRRRFLARLRGSRILPEDLKAGMDAGEMYFILDLRQEHEVRDSGFRLPGAVWFPRRDIETKPHLIPRDRDIVVYCA
ncbi:MAG: VTT domain-containing protein [Bryobacteraceae bacterium]|nr:VTT domain-containing protein [Bryobacteraceae bacterium]